MAYTPPALTFKVETRIYQDSSGCVLNRNVTMHGDPDVRYYHTLGMFQRQFKDRAKRRQCDPSTGMPNYPDAKYFYKIFAFQYDQKLDDWVRIETV